MLQTEKEVMQEIKSIIGDAEEFAKGTFHEMPNKEKLTFIGYQLYRKGYYDGLASGLEEGIRENMKREIRDKVEKESREADARL